MKISRSLLSYKGIAYGALLAVSSSALLTHAAGADGLFGDYFTRMVGSCNTTNKEVLTGFSTTTYGQRQCTGLQSLIADLFGGQEVAGQAVVGFNSDGTLKFGTVADGVWTKVGSNVYTSGSSDKVGIGTSTPRSKLDVNGSMVTGDSNGYAMFVPKPGTDPWTNYDRFEIRVHNASPVTYLGNAHGGTGSPRSLALMTAGAERMRIDTTGNIGIGTSSPAYKLDVNGDSRSTGNVGIATGVPVSNIGLNLNLDVSNNTSQGLYSNITSTGTYTANRNYYGTYNVVTNNANNSTYTAGAFGSYNYALNTSVLGTGNKNIFGSYNYARNYATGSTVANAYGGYFTVGQTYGTITNGYGVYIGNVDGNAATTYGLYQSDSAGKNYFAGNVGIGTTTPSYKLHVAGDIYANGGWLRTSGNAGWYNESYGGGFYMIDSTWIRTYGNKNVYHNTGIFRTDGTLQVGPGGSTFYAANGGNIGINTSTPTEKLDVNGYVRIRSTNGEGGTILLDGENGKKVWLENINGKFRVINDPWSAELMTVDQSGNARVAGSMTAQEYMYTSDMRLKKDIHTLMDAESLISSLRGVGFNWKSTGEKDIGFIAQEVEKILPDLVKTDESGYKSVKYGNITAVLVEALKSQITKNAEQQKQIDAQELRIQKLEKLLEAMEK